MRIPLKAASVIVGATVLSTLGIAASDSVRGISNSLMGLAIESGESTQCPAGMTPVSVRGSVLCVDTYEVSTHDSCAHVEPKNVMQSEENIAEASCVPVSQADVQPWRFVSLTQAQQACAKAGKRLPTNEEWYRAALGTQADGGCYTKSGGVQSPRPTGAGTCVSGSGIEDMIGNVWEWVDESVTEGTYAGRALPASGYVSSVDADGVALASDLDVPQDLYGEDYFWSVPEGIKGMVRGGFYASEDDAGMYALNASIEFSFASPGIGFRCVQEALF